MELKPMTYLELIRRRELTVNIKMKFATVAEFHVFLFYAKLENGPVMDNGVHT